jgi:CDP-diacylglycerol--serine O-phosphatidyltransferase
MHRDDERRRLTVLGPLRRRRGSHRPRFRRGVYLLPSLFTLANMFCGYACIVYAMRGEYATAAPFIGFALVLDMLDGRIARMTGTASAFGLEFDSLADVISFGVAPAVLTFSWGLQSLGRLGWAVSFIYVTGTAMRLARFNIQTHSDKRYFVGMPAPAAGAVLASTVFAMPDPITDYRIAAGMLAMVLVPSFLMVSTIRFRSFKTLDLKKPRPYTVLLLLALGFVAITTHPRSVLVILSYTYLMSAFVGMAWSRLRRRAPESAAGGEAPAKAAAAEPVEQGRERRKFV